MTNYMGKNRLLKIFYRYSNQSEKELLYCEYRKYRGSEWLVCRCEGYKFNLYVCGGHNKFVSLEEFAYNYDDTAEQDYTFIRRVHSYYTQDFYPHPDNKDKMLDCYDIVKKNKNAKILIH